MDNSFYGKNFTCKVCGHQYEAQRPRRRACIPLRRDTDFNVIYQDVCCLHYEVAVCPACGYASTDSMADPSVAARKVYQTEIAPRWEARDLNGIRSAEDAITCFKLALLSGQVQNDKASVMAALALRIAWIYRGLGDHEQEERFLAMALKDYETAYSKEDLQGDGKEITIAYLIGELHRRLGRPEQALRWFSIVIGHPEAGEKAQVIRMAREQWHLIRDQQRGEQP